MTAAAISSRMGLTSGCRRASASVVTPIPRSTLSATNRSVAMSLISGSAAMRYLLSVAVVIPADMRPITVPDCIASRSVHRGDGSMRAIICTGSQTSAPMVNPVNRGGMIPTTCTGDPSRSIVDPRSEGFAPNAPRQSRSEMSATVVGLVAPSSSASNSRPVCGCRENVVNRDRVIASMRTGRSSSGNRKIASLHAAKPTSSRPRAACRRRSYRAKVHETVSSLARDCTRTV